MTAAAGPEVDIAAAREIAEAVVDPEMPYVTLGDLGIIGQISLDPEGTLTVEITPTYAACPAMAEIKYALHQRLQAAGLGAIRLRTVLNPPWSTDRITAVGRAKLLAAGIAPPPSPDGSVQMVQCPRCGSNRTELLSRFSGTACKALYRCLACTEPFEQIKAV